MPYSRIDPIVRGKSLIVESMGKRLRRLNSTILPDYASQAIYARFHSVEPMPPSIHEILRRFRPGGKLELEPCIEQAAGDHAPALQYQLRFRAQEHGS